ncbi:MAG TPA: DUF4349 domain-containing protein [Solirubrobacteraceae bacterium]|nr:DUF4349 domain-containing protein [Solirubrobacteraceae bacterium]
MRVIPFPTRESASADEAWLMELDAALDGHGVGAAADSWRELRDDVRALAPPIDHEFEARFRERIAERPSRRSGGVASPLRVRPLASVYPAAAALAVTCTLVVLALAIAPWRTSNGASDRSTSVSTATRAFSGASPALGAAATTAQPSAPAAQAPEGASQSVAPAGTAGRVQQLAATLSLTTIPGNVQAVAAKVARLTASDGGFVQSSNVQVQKVGQSEATLVLKLPSRRLSAALASLAQLAPVRAENQSLQDITSSYDAARQRLVDATAERRALLRALAAASSEAKVQELRAQLAQVRATIARARSGFEAVSRRASMAEVEVSVLGDAHAPSEGLTLSRGLHDAGRVLRVSLAVLIVAAAVLVPVTVLLAMLLGGRRMWRRSQRERVLDRS